MDMDRIFLLTVLLVGVCGVVAQDSCLGLQEGEVRLSGLGSSSAGLVEICRSGTWGAVCVETSEDAWREKNAQVACIELEYSGALNSLLQRTAPEIGVGTPFHHSNVRCHGNESRLADCSLTNESQCPQNRAAAIVCRETLRLNDVRLMGDVDNGEGAVELNTEAGWVRACPDSDTWGDSQANAVCVQLGYDTGTAMAYNLSASDNLRMTVNADCSGENVFIFAECDITVTATSCSANPSMFAGVMCQSSSLPEGSVRLFGPSGPGDDVSEGRVEVLYDGRWGAVCDDTLWSANDGETVCRQIGVEIESFTQVSTNPRGEYAGGSENRPIWLGRMGCDSNSPNLNSCDRVDQHIGYTTFCEGRGIISDDDAAVNCNSTATATVASPPFIFITAIPVTLYYTFKFF